MTLKQSPTAAAYVRTINTHDAAAFHALFAADALVEDAAGRRAWK